MGIYMIRSSIPTATFSMTQNNYFYIPLCLLDISRTPLAHHELESVIIITFIIIITTIITTTIIIISSGGSANMPRHAACSSVTAKRTGPVYISCYTHTAI